MDYEIIGDIELILRGHFEQSKEMPLHEILWSINSRHGLIPSLSELNAAAKKVGGIKVLRRDN